MEHKLENLLDAEPVQKLLDSFGEEKYRDIFDNFVEAVFQTTPEGRFIRINHAGTQMFGASSPEEMINSVSDIGRQIYVNPDDRRKLMTMLAENGQVKNFVIEARRGNGLKGWLLINARAVCNNNGEIIYIEGACSDISERKQMEDQLKYLSEHDMLTGLYNRYYFDQVLRRIEETAIPAGVIMCDIDGLKLVNDTLGHRAGDELLAVAAGLIKASFSYETIIARIGGDEFTVLMPFTDEAGLEETVNRINCGIEEYNELNSQLRLSISMGFACRSDGTVNIYDILKRADSHMYRKKLCRSQSTRSTIANAFKRTMETADSQFDPLLVDRFLTAIKGDIKCIIK